MSAPRTRIGDDDYIGSDQHIADIRSDHYVHRLFHLLLAVYAWQVHGLWVAAAITIVVGVLIAITNLFIVAKDIDWKWIRRSRWGWLIAGYLAVMLSGTTISQA